MEGESILVVDDEAIVLDVLKVALKKAGFAVFTASRIIDAQALAHGQRFACALVDKNLPDGSGLELIKMLRARQPDCTCLVMTAYPNADSILEALKLGAVDYLEKPFPHVSIIQEKVKAAVERQRRLTALSARVAEMHALKAANEAAAAEELMLQARVDSLNFKHQRVMAMLREVALAIDTQAGDEAAMRKLAMKVATLLHELK